MRFRPFLVIVLGFSGFLQAFVSRAQEISADKKKLPTALYTLSGRIFDEKSKEPLVGATVYLTDDKKGTLTDTSGSFSIHQLAAGHHVVEISHTGYSTLVEHIEMKAAVNRNFYLAPVYLENQGVVVTGISAATSIRKATAPMSLLSQRSLAEIGSTNIIAALEKVPGVSQVSSGPAVSKPVIRGLGYNRVVVVNDGVRQEGQQWGDEHGIEVDEFSVNKVEILKGPASLLYGSDALAGVIHFISAPAVEEGIVKALVNTQYQSNSRLGALNARVSGTQKGFNWSGYGTIRSAADYHNRYDGIVLNSRFKELNGGGQLGWNRSWGYSQLLFSVFDLRPGMIEGERDALTGNFLLHAGSSLEQVAGSDQLHGRKPWIPFQRVQHRKLVSDNNFIVGGSRIKLNLALQQNKRREFGDPLHPGEAQLYFDLKTLNYTLHWKLPEKKEWHTTVGLNGMWQTNQNQGLESLIPDYHLLDAGLFIHTQRLYQKASWSGGFRVDTRSTSTAESVLSGTPQFVPLQRNFSNWSGSFGVSYEPIAALTLKLNWARGFRAPTMAELSSNGSHEGTNRYEYGNKELQSETSWQLDAGIEYGSEHFNIGLSFFRNSVQDFIFYRKLLAVSGGDSLVTVDGKELTAFIFQQQHALLTGLEMNIDIHPHPLHWLHFENSFSWVRGQFEHPIDPASAGSDRLPLIPAPRWNGELRGDFKKGIASLRNLYVKVETEKTWPQNRFFSGYDTETATNGYWLLNAAVGASITNQKKRSVATLHLILTNLGNLSWQSHLSRLKYLAINPVTGRQGVFQPGRNLTLKLQCPLVWKQKE